MRALVALALAGLMCWPAASAAGVASDAWRLKASRRSSPGAGRVSSQLLTTNLARLSARLIKRGNASKQVASARRRTGPQAQLHWGLPEGWRLQLRSGRQTPAFIDNGTARPLRAARRAGNAAQRAAPSAMAVDILAAHRDIFGLQAPGDELRHMETVRSDDGRLRVRFARRVEGIPVWGEDLTVHLDADGELFAFNGVYSATAPAAAAVVVSGDAARRIATGHLSLHQPVVELSAVMRELLAYAGPTAELMLQPQADGAYRPVWRVDIRPNARDHWVYAVDAVSGVVVERYNATPWQISRVTASAQDLHGATRQVNAFAVADSFLLIDGSRPMFATVQPDLVRSPRGALVTLTAGQQDLTRTTRVDHVVSTDNNWPDVVAVSAHTNTGTVFDYFLQTHGRLSIDGVGGSMFSIIHVTDDNRPMDNAFWSGTFIAYGDGDQAFLPLAAGLDVAAHEMSHGVIQHTVNLEYRNHSGALNESFADVFGVMVDRDDWQLGEDVVQSTAFFPSGALRDMADPHNGNQTGGSSWQPAHMDEFRELPLSVDNGGVHINSGIPNRACFLLAEAIGRDKTEQIYYRILDARLINQRGNFIDMRNAARQAAGELFGADEIAAVEAAFDAVGIIGDVGYEAPAGRAPLPGEQRILVVSAQANDRGLYLVKPDLQSDDDITLLTSTPVLDQTGNSVTVAADGSFVLFIDAANNLRAINIDGSDETVVSDTRDWGSISLSPDGTQLAATTTFEDGSIVILDLEVAERSRVIPLRRPTTQQGVSTSVVLFADALDWDPSGEFLLYDAFNAIPRASGDSLSFWDVNLLEPEEGFIVPLLPPQAEGVQLGNPTMARSSGRHVVFDRFDSAADSNEIWVFDLVTGRSGRIVSTGAAIGFPTFSPDDSELAFERRDRFGRTVVHRIRLSESRLQAVGEERLFLTGAQIPNWFVLADDDPATAVEENQDDPAPTTSALLGNYPNPFNPVTAIRFQLAHTGMTDLAVYDVRGALVAHLVRQDLAAGSHEVRWNGRDGQGRPVASGVYFARLRVPGPRGAQFDETRRMMLIR